MVKLSISVLLSLATISIRSNSVVAYRSHCNSIKLFSKSNCHYSSKDTLGNSYRHSYSSCYSNCYRHNQIYLSRFCLLQMTTQSTTTPTASSLLECQLDSYQRISHNKVLNCQQDTDSGNYILTLDNSVLYPEGGGQPWDLGTVNGIEVVKVLKTKNTANSNSDSTTVDVYVKDAVPIDTVVECKVDWERRYDHMQQHTAQHLFSAIAHKLFQADTVGWSLGNDSVSVDLKPTTTPLTSESIYEIERVTNSYIASGSAVTASVYRKEEVILAIDNSESATQSNPIEQTRIDKNLLRGAPKGAALDMDELRLVCIDNLDLNPCGGTHLKRISEINLLKVLSIEKDRGALRVRFVSGLRALNYFNSCISNENKLNMLLAVPPKEHTLFVEKLLKDKKDQLKQIEKNNLELAELYGKDLVNKCVDHLSKKIRETKYYFVVNSSLIIMDLRINTNLQFIINSGNHILKQLETKQNELVANGITNTILILFATNDDIVINANSKKGKKGTEQENQDEPIKLPIHTSGPFILFGENDIVNIVRDDILNTITGKGGGRPGRLQGQAKNIENYSEIIPQLKNKLV